jgi:hypothetical protein
MTLYLADTELTKTQTFTAIYWPQQKALHLFTDEFRLERRLQGLGLVAGSRSSLFSGPEAFRQQPWFCRLKFPGLMKKTKKTRSGGTGCGTQWVSGSRRGYQLNAAAGRRTAVATGRCSTLRVEPWYPRYAGWKTVIAGCREKIAQLEGKNGRKTVNYFT